MLSYQKMVGQLQDVGNTTTLAHYLDLLDGAGMVAGLQKYAGQSVRSRASSPKLQVLNTALLSAQSPFDLTTAMEQRDWWGRLVESAIGAHIMNGIVGTWINVARVQASVMGLKRGPRGTLTNFYTDRQINNVPSAHENRGLIA